MPGPNDSRGVERRTATRVRHEAEILVEVGGVTLHASSEDLSSGGVRLCFATAAPPEGTPLVLRFALPEIEGLVVVEAIVRWVHRVSSNVCGVQFTTGLRAREVWAIQRLNSP